MTTTNFVDWEIGQAPLLIACPHDGRLQPSGTPERPDQQEGCGRAKKQADVSTRIIALGLRDAVEAMTGSKPSIVIARFHRRYIDANRSRQCGFKARVAARFYDEYHHRIDLAIAAIKKQFPKRGVLVDIHGAADQTDRPDIQVLLGSDSGNSIRRLLELDPLILFRRNGIVRTLQGGGFASHASGLDALHVETVRSVRTQAQRRSRVIQTLAQGLVRLLDQQRRLVRSRLH